MDNDIQKSHIDELYRCILKLETMEECSSFFSDLCSSSELKSLSLRWLVARELDAGMTYQEIAQQRTSSSATISRVSKCLANKDSGYAKMLQKIKESE